MPKPCFHSRVRSRALFVELSGYYSLLLLPLVQRAADLFAERSAVELALPRYRLLSVRALPSGGRSCRQAAPRGGNVTHVHLFLH